MSITEKMAAKPELEKMTCFFLIFVTNSNQSILIFLALWDSAPCSKSIQKKVHFKRTAKSSKEVQKLVKPEHKQQQWSLVGIGK